MTLARKLLLLVSAAMLALLAACNGGDPAPAPAAMPSSAVQTAPPQAAPAGLPPLTATLVGEWFHARRTVPDACDLFRWTPVQLPTERRDRCRRFAGQDSCLELELPGRTEQPSGRRR